MAVTGIALLAIGRLQHETRIELAAERRQEVTRSESPAQVARSIQTAEQTAHIAVLLRAPKVPERAKVPHWRASILPRNVPPYSLPSEWPAVLPARLVKPVRLRPPGPPLAGARMQLLSLLTPPPKPVNVLPSIGLGEPRALTQCEPHDVPLAKRSKTPEVIAAKLSPKAFGAELAKAALQQLKTFVIYNARYMQISYPMGDVPAMYGVCTDVVIRAYRRLGIDLQMLVRLSGLGRGDTSIDHRRVKVLRKFFERYGLSLPVTREAADYAPGDIVTYYRPGGRTSTSHIAIVTARKTPDGIPMRVHNTGNGVQLDGGTFDDEITGHYRFTGAPVLAGAVEAELKRIAALAKPGAPAVKRSARKVRSRRHRSRSARTARRYKRRARRVNRRRARRVGRLVMLSSNLWSNPRPQSRRKSPRTRSRRR